MCIPLKARSTLGFRVASERALCIHTLKAGSTVMALLRTLVDVWDRPGGEKKDTRNVTLRHWMAVWLKVRLQNGLQLQLAVFERRKKKESKKTEFAENTKVGNASFPVINNRLAILCQLNNIFADLIRQKAHIIEFLSGDCCRSFPCTCPAGDLSPVSHLHIWPAGFFSAFFLFCSINRSLRGITTSGEHSV